MVSLHSKNSLDTRVDTAADRLRITEIFYSLQGESRTVGVPTVFIRLTGCPLRCVYCDTRYAFRGGEWLDIHEVLTEVAGYNPLYITITGGEPLAQRQCRPLLAALCDEAYKVSLETSGAVTLEDIDPRVSIVMDIKTPGSGEGDRNLRENIQLLRAKDQVKFVLLDRTDYEWARETLREYGLSSVCEVLFSPVDKKLNPTDLAEWILEDHLAVRMQIQLHKILWNGAHGR
ncbi:MAG TPA: 7-carboxy-7-deazaguanine synthase QueE [Acidiferrobacteraceae bacterium]|nr:7-carboxy-7-deazaguanine synthase QueE [Acidiferrobacteraceae bacterium]